MTIGKSPQGERVCDGAFSEDAGTGDALGGLSFMSGLPWFPLWAGDFLLSRRTARMDAKSVGIFMLLLMHEWLDGPLPKNTDDIAFLGRCSPDEAEAVLERCFIETEAGFVNEKLESIRAEQVSKRLRLSNAGRKGGEKSKPRLSQAEARPKQSESELDTETETKETTYASDFEVVWGLHRRGPKKDALTYYKKAVANGVTHDALVVALSRYVSTLRPDFQGVHLFRWLRDERWDENQPTSANPYANADGSPSELWHKEFGQ